jgi:hypothetical protein
MTGPAREAGLTREAKQRLWKQFDRTATAWEKKYRDEAERQFKEDHKALLVILRKAPRLGGVAVSGVGPDTETKAEVDWQTVAHNWQWYFEQAGEERWREAFVPLIQGTITQQAEALNLAFGMQFDIVNLFAVEAFDNYMITFAQQILEATDYDTRALLQTAMAKGWSIPDMQNGLNTLFETYLKRGGLTDEERAWFQDRRPGYRLENIARTETTKAANFGSWQLYNAWGAPMKEWLGTPDDRIRPDHLDAMVRYSEGGNPGPIPINEAFVVGGVHMMHPGDGPPEQVCNCRCTTLPYNPAWATL